MSIITFFIRVFSRKSTIQDNLYMKQKTKDDIRPPWVTFPEFSPFDFFWRDAGQPWLCYIWNPFWEKMSKEDQAIYLDIWNAPEIWRFFL